MTPGDEATAAPPPPAESEPRRRRPSARFRARLGRDPRRWVLCIVALEGPLAATMNLSEKRDSLFSQGFGAPLLLALLALLPATAVLTMFVHGRLLYWSGKLLKGAARTHEIHAAFAWSQLPFVATAWPLVLEVPLRAAATDADPVPPALQAAIDLTVAISAPVEWIAAVAALVGAFLWIKFLAEAQRFSAWRAIANQVMAGLTLVVLLAAGIGLAVAAIPKSNALLYGAIGSTFVLLAVAIPALIGRARAA